MEAVLIVITLSCSLSFTPLLCAVRSWYAGCCCATRGLRVCSIVPPLPHHYIGFSRGVACIGNYVTLWGGVGSSYPPPSLWKGEKKNWYVGVDFSFFVRPRHIVKVYHDIV